MKKELTFQERFKKVLEEYEKTNLKYNVIVRPVILFHGKPKAPFYAKWAWKVVQLAGGTLDIEFVDNKQNGN